MVPSASAVRAEEVVLAIRHAGVVRVGRGAETELVWVEALGVLECEAVLQGLAGIAADDMGDAAFRIAEQVREDLEVGELVIGREQRMGLRLPL